MSEQTMDDNVENGALMERRSSLEEPASPASLASRGDLEKKFNTVSFRGERSRGGAGEQGRRKRLSIINNHIYDLDVSSVRRAVHPTQDPGRFLVERQCAVFSPTSLRIFPKL